MFVIYVAIQKQEEMLVHFEKWAQLKAKDLNWVLLFNKALTAILAKYSNYNNIFSIKNRIEFPSEPL